jgi:glutamyl-tRNA reductase
MIDNFKVVSISYKNAPVEIRELASLNESQSKQLMMKLKDTAESVSEILVLSTCNRTEIYYSSPQSLYQEIIKWIGILKGIENFSNYLPYFLNISDHQSAVQHLFNVSIGLESQVVGDLQIINQSKHAYQWSADMGMAGPFLHRIMHTIFFTNKKVVQETSFRDGAASVSYATVEQVEILSSQFTNPKILVIGIGEMGADVCKNLSVSGFSNITLTNRTIAKAEKLAEEIGASVVSYSSYKQAIKDSDIIICSVSSEHPIVTKADLLNLEIHSHKFFIDISVPRNVENSVEEIPGVLVYNIDHIQNRANEALEKRVQSIPFVKGIISDSIAEFNNWSKEMVVSPTINRLKNALEQIRQEEVSRYLKVLSEEESSKVDMITKSIMQKIIKLPVLQLKAACKRGEAETLMDVLNDLFDLEKQSDQVSNHSS